MTHRIVVDLQTGVTTQVEYTPEEQAVHDAAVAAQQAAQQAEYDLIVAARQAAELAAQQTAEQAKS
jgi:hypothetical protein